MRKFDNTGGIASVRVIPLMQDGGLAEKRLADGPPGGPKQFEVPDERMITKRREVNTFPIPVPGDEPMSSEPNYDTGAQEFPGPGLEFQDFIFNTPTIKPSEVYPMDPDPGIMFNPSMGGVPNLLQANLLQPGGNNGIFDLLGKLNNEKPVGSYNI